MGQFVPIDTVRCELEITIESCSCSSETWLDLELCVRFSSDIIHWKKSKLWQEWWWKAALWRCAKNCLAMIAFRPLKDMYSFSCCGCNFVSAAQGQAIYWLCCWNEHFFHRPLWCVCLCPMKVVVGFAALPLPTLWKSVLRGQSVL